MFGHRSFLVIGGDNSADIRSLESGGYEMHIVTLDLNRGLAQMGR
jgi:hypothetical protein